jgi:hypothetical protein
VLEVKRVANGYVRDDSNTIFTDKIFNQALMVRLYNAGCHSFLSMAIVCLVCN